MKRLQACLFGLLLAACGEPLVMPQLVLEARVLGAQLSPLDEPRSQRAELAPGEFGRLRFLVASPEDVEVQAVVHVCRDAGTSLGAPVCAGELLASQRIAGNTREDLSLEFQLSETLDPGEDWLIWAGFCAGGRAKALSADRFACETGQPLETFARFKAARPEDGRVNLNPDLSDDRLSLGGRAWAEAPWLEAGEACASSELPRVIVGETESLRFRLTGEDRQPRVDEAGQFGAPSRESLTYSHAATLSGLERAFSAIDHNSDAADFELEWDLGASASQPPDSEGRVETFYLVVRDDRGGADWLRRQVCLIDE
ncbi:MAG: hypothetical protein RJA70_2198 [Pseudomonadota bacterium]|jgi:hypothetical protein